MSRFAFVLFLACFCLPLRAAEPGFKAGVARANITPKEFMWMAGYGSRNKIAEGKTHDLFAKALALEDSNGQRLVLVTTDLIGLPRTVSEVVFESVKDKAKLTRGQLLLNASHTHCGPVVNDNLMDMYPLNDAQRKQVVDYTANLREALAKVVLDAVADLKPASISHGEGSALFALNRREKKGDQIINGFNREGPVDHSVPVLKVEAGGKLLAVVFGYACHNTTQSYYQWCGDYAGFAQIEIEKAHPGTTALYWIGCGGDVNPQPRGKEELCIKHGKELADGVAKALKGEMKPITGSLAGKYATVDLKLDGSATKESLLADQLKNSLAHKNRATRLLKMLAETGSMTSNYPHYPVQVWKLGDQLTWVGLGGEVVLDYAIRIRKELPKNRSVWVAGYCNDVMAYIPSKRVLIEGGYEGESSMVYYGLPGKWADTIEEKIIGKVHELAK
ncbi:MAG: neutral/alkaline non-lysosomal ceramidase N-terminal domain-containing protein [Gemmataceae bacterium]|nr:neutral/alkaline non-lysosomal ceramidase N-terminal domain-containing protein [Gemmataceae bacterium]